MGVKVGVTVGVTGQRVLLLRVRPRDTRSIYLTPYKNITVVHESSQGVRHWVLVAAAGEGKGYGVYIFTPYKA